MKHLLSLVLALFCGVALAGPPSTKESLAQEKLSKGELQTALKLYREISLDEKNSRELREKASNLAVDLLMLIAQKSEEPLRIYKNAKEEYLQQIKLHPQNDMLFFELGMLLRRLEDRSGALDAFSASSRLGHHNATLYLAELYFKDKKYAQAAVAYQKALQKTPESASLWASLGHSHFWRNDFLAAEEAYGRAYVLRYTNDLFLRRYCLTLSKLEKHDDAIKLAEQIIELTRDDFQKFEFLIFAAGIYADAAQTQRAIYLLKRAEEIITIMPTNPAIQPNHARLLNNHAWYICTTKQKTLQTPEIFEEAYQMATKAVDLSERKNGAYLDTKAEAAFLLGRYQEAIELETEALALDRTHPFYLSQLARYKEGQRNAPPMGEPLVD